MENSNIETLARQLGVAIQADESYKSFMALKDTVESDESISSMMEQIEQLRNQYQAEASKQTPDQLYMTKLDTDFQNLYGTLMAKPAMAQYEQGRQALDAIMNNVMQILYLSVNGEDPMTCDPNAEENCGGDCGSCGGC
jgi:cell fate (sporulation/competence/biofilm development) regulator YlbF (YheA/YmcA/DUF963 family)